MNSVSSVERATEARRVIGGPLLRCHLFEVRLSVWELRPIAGYRRDDAVGGFFHEERRRVSAAATCQRIVPHLDGCAPRGVAVVAHCLIGKLQVIFERAMRSNACGLEHAVIGADGLLRIQLAVGNEAEHLEECKLMLGVVDLAAEQGHARAVFLRVVNEPEGIVGRARAAAEYAHDQVRIVLGQLFHRLWTVIDDFQEDGPPGFRHAGQGAEDVIVEELAQLLRRDAAVHVRVEDFEKMPELLPLRFFTKCLVPKQGLAVLLQVVDERDRVEAQVRAGEIVARAVALDLAALDVVDGRAAKRLRWLARVAAVAHGPHVGRVVGARGGRDAGVVIEPFLDGELLVHVGGHQHDVDEALVGDLADDVEELRQVAITELVASPDLGRKLREPGAAPREVVARPRRADAKGHVGVLGVGDDECARARIRFDLSEFGVEGFHNFTLANVSFSALADCCNAIISLGHSLISTCRSTPVRPTTDGTLRQMSRMPYAPWTREETGRNTCLSRSTAWMTSRMAMPTAQPAPPLRLMTSAPLPLVRSKTAFWKPGVHSGSPASGRPVAVALDQTGTRESPCSPRMRALTWVGASLSSSAMNELKREVSSIVPRP